MVNKTNSKKGLSRRDFLKGTAVTLAGASVAGLAMSCASRKGLVSEEEETDEVSGASLKAKSGPVHDDWLGRAPEIAESDIVKTVESAVVIIGCGHAGLQAAWALSKKNVKTSVIEPQTREKHHHHSFPLQ